MERRIVCLANSKMPGGRCFAGKELINNKPAGWIRVLKKVGKKGGVPWEEFLPIQPLQIINVLLDKPVPDEPQPGKHQRENWLLDNAARPPRWKRENRSWSTPAQLVDHSVERLWINECKTKYGKNDIVPYHQIENMKVNNSLRFIYVEELALSAHGWQVLGNFQYNGEEYSLKVTDPNYETPASKGFSKNKKIHKCFLTVSLAGRWGISEGKDNCHKLIATIIPMK